MARVQFTADELIGTLRRSSLPTILVEGADDIVVYRQIEELFGSRVINFMPCGGRGILLELFRRRAEFTNIKTHFIADKDMWLFVGIPTIPDLSDVFFTQGYCLENDLYFDGNILLDGLLSPEELRDKSEILQSLAQWYAFEVDLYTQGNTTNNYFSSVTILNEQIMQRRNNSFEASFLTSRNFTPPPIPLYDDILENYIIKLRGKFIFQIFEKIFARRPRGRATFNKYQLFELCYREGIRPQNQSSCMNRILNSIKCNFNI